MSFQLSGSAPEIYERTMVPLWFGRWAEALMDVVSPQFGEKILDVACGTGVTTRLAKRAVGPLGKVDGLDNNTLMLARAIELDEVEDIGWIESDVVDTRRPSGMYDAVISQHGYHYFPDKPAALKEFRRVLAPNGRLVFSVWDGHSVYTQALCAAVEKHISPEIAQKQRSQRETPGSETLARELDEEEFEDIAIKRQELTIEIPLAHEFVPLHLGSMPIAGAFQSLPDKEKTALIDDVEAALSDHVEHDKIIYGDAVLVATGRR